jgi:membrane-associated phospholipid phosphatase
VAGLILGSAALLSSASRARQGVTDPERRVFRSINELPDRLYRPVWAVMQYGTFGTVPALAAVALVGRRPRRALGLAVGGTGAWAAAKGVKRIVRRGRPSVTMVGVRLRGKEEGDLGFPSGHAAVSAALTTVAWPSAGPRWRATSTGLTVLVPLARVYVGAHLPLDCVGGAGLGLAIGSAVNLAIGGPNSSDHPR